MSRPITRIRYWATLLLIILVAIIQGMLPPEWRWITAILTGVIYAGALARFVMLPKPKPTDADREQPDRERLP